MTAHVNSISLYKEKELTHISLILASKSLRVVLLEVKFVKVLLKAVYPMQNPRLIIPENG